MPHSDSQIFLRKLPKGDGRLVRPCKITSTRKLIADELEERDSSFKKNDFWVPTLGSADIPVVTSC